ncbi:MAG: Gfo/Idh/MocA family oxidoreductase [Trueperaceae bacterium]
MTSGSNDRKFRVGVVGLGWAGEQHLAGYRKLPNVEIRALAGLENDRLEELGREHGIQHLHRDYQDLVARDDIDAVSVCTPNHLHAPITIAAIEHGKHVLCEKPLARGHDEAEAMVRAAVRADRVLHVAFNHRQRGDVQVLRRFLDQDQLGRIYHVKATWMRRSGIPGLGSWFTSRQMAGGGPLIDLGVHILDLALFLLGEPEVRSVSAATYAELGPHGRGFSGSKKMTVGSAYEVEDLAIAFLRLGDGSTLNLEASWAVYGGYNDDFGITLYGTEGGAEIRVRDYRWQDTLRIYTDTAGVPAVLSPEVPKGEGHLAVVRDFVAAACAETVDHAPAVAGLRRVRIIDACYRSAVEGRELEVSHD